MLRKISTVGRDQRQTDDRKQTPPQDDALMVLGCLMLMFGTYMHKAMTLRSPGEEIRKTVLRARMSSVVYNDGWLMDLADWLFGNIICKGNAGVVFIDRTAMAKLVRRNLFVYMDDVMTEDGFRILSETLLRDYPSFSDGERTTLINFLPKASFGPMMWRLRSVTCRELRTNPECTNDSNITRVFASFLQGGVYLLPCDICVYDILGDYDLIAMLSSMTKMATIPHGREIISDFEDVVHDYVNHKLGKPYFK